MAEENVSRQGSQKSAISTTPTSMQLAQKDHVAGLSYREGNNARSSSDVTKKETVTSQGNCADSSPDSGSGSSDMEDRPRSQDESDHSAYEQARGRPLGRGRW